MNITDTSNLEAIFDAVYAIAQATPGITWQQTYQGLWPSNADIRTYPTLVCPYPEFEAFGAGGVPVGDTLVEGSKTMEMFHLFSIFCVAPYSPTDQNTWRIPMQAKKLLEKQFRANRTLNSTCFNSKLRTPHLIEWFDKQDPSLHFFGCTLEVVAWEQVLTPDS